MLALIAHTQVYGCGLMLSLLSSGLSAVGAQGSSVLFFMGAGLGLVAGYVLDGPVSTMYACMPCCACSVTSMQVQLWSSVVGTRHDMVWHAEVHPSFMMAGCPPFPPSLCVPGIHVLPN